MENVETQSDQQKERSNDDAVIDIEVEGSEHVNTENNVETERDQMEGNEIESDEMEGDDAKIDLELATSLWSELGSLCPLFQECTIHRVQESLRQLDEKAYTPRVVSIGPVHHGKHELRAMEEYKRRYLEAFLKRTTVRLEDFIRVIRKNEAKVRNCYAETIELDSNNFVKMILLDASFIVQLLITHFEGTTFAYDRVCFTPQKIWDIKKDLYILENQVPFFILEDLFRLANINISINSEEKLSILKLTHSFTYSYWGHLGMGMDKDFDESKYRGVYHLVHFLRISVVPSKPQLKEAPKILTTPSVIELHQAGVKFKLASSKNLFDIRFHNGILEIPRITIKSPTENMVKNLLAFEQSKYGAEELLINDYVIFMNYLVSTPKDVELLVQHKIIHSPLGDYEQVSSLFHRLNQRPFFRPVFLFSALIEDLNEYCKRPWHQWKATLKEDYFKTPWTTVSVIAATILLILTSIQTICSILQLK